MTRSTTLVLNNLSWNNLYQLLITDLNSTGGGQGPNGTDITFAYEQFLPSFVKELNITLTNTTAWPGNAGAVLSVAYDNRQEVGDSLLSGTSIKLGPFDNATIDMNTNWLKSSVLDVQVLIRVTV